jgi:hypothetical protein
VERLIGEAIEVEHLNDEKRFCAGRGLQPSSPQGGRPLPPKKSELEIVGGAIPLYSKFYVKLCTVL